MATHVLTAERLWQLLDYDHLSGTFAWRFTRGGKSKLGSKVGGLVDGYVKIMIDGKTYAAHRLAFLYMTGQWPQYEIDHINGVRSDNRWENLRDIEHATNTENTHRARITNHVGLLGVSAHHLSARYRARIRTQGKLIQLGWFDTPQEAHAAYVTAKRSIHVGCTI